jgi:cytochrome P450
MILTWLGVPKDGREFLTRLDDEAIRKSVGSLDARASAYAAREQANSYFGKLLTQRRASGPIGDDVLSYLVTAQVDGRELTMTEMLRICSVLYSAGLHTTATSLSNMMVYLAQHLDLRDRLVADASLIPSVVEEFMRYESITALTRIANKDVTIGGRLIREGEALLLFTGAAGRDPEYFERPDEVVIGRTNNRHLNFGVGPHRCLGSHMARMELRVALEAIHARFPHYQLAPNMPLVRHGGAERSTDELWLTLQPDNTTPSAISTDVVASAEPCADANSTTVSVSRLPTRLPGGTNQPGVTQTPTAPATG